MGKLIKFVHKDKSMPKLEEVNDPVIDMTVILRAVKRLSKKMHRSTIVERILDRASKSKW